MLKTELREAVLPKMSFGWELEATQHINNHVPGIEVTHDGSVNGEHLEYRVKRSLVFNPDESLAALRKVATDPGILTDKSCGFHVHLGMVNRTRRLHAWAAWFIQLARDVEDEAFAAVPASRLGNRFCRSWKDTPESVITYRYEASKYSNRDRYNWVNPTEIFRPGGIRTVEIRLMGNTHRYSQLLAWASACRMMGLSAWALISDPSRLEYERNEVKHTFRMIRRTFIEGGTTNKEAVKLALYLASKAQFYQPFGKPLAKLKLSEAGSQVEVFKKGDIVECIERDPEGGIFPGGQYQVIQAIPSRELGREYDLQVRVASGGWWVPARCVRVVQREVTPCVA
jgi:hypothetical protein